ncbi:DUF2649 family protein [Spiroplasma endosymbiont of Dilophus febrilis]|uniref:DUF2649 family protein n=1 Tax=Spiroplasma endosymbiont of Dilophus febrilis TaxID=3066292 RepID=UPI00313C95C9
MERIQNIMQKDWEKFQEFLIKIFIFIPKNRFENIVPKLTDTNYYIMMCGIWLVIIVFIWFVLWITFKILSW